MIVNIQLLSSPTFGANEAEVVTMLVIANMDLNEMISCVGSPVSISIECSRNVHVCPLLDCC